MKRKLLGLSIVLAFLAIPLGINKLHAHTPKKAELNTVVLKSIQPSILATGNLVFRQEVQLSSEVIGKVAEILIREGDPVTKNQLLLRLDPTLYRAAVEQQEANQHSAEIAIERAMLNVANQERNFDRSSRLAQAKFIDASKHDDARHQLELVRVELRASQETNRQAMAQLLLAQEGLAKTEVRSPISGTVTSIQIKVGETAVPSALGIAGSSLMTIADVGSIMAEVNVDEADIGSTVLNQRAKVYPSAYPERPVGGIIERVSMTPKVNAQGRSYVVKLRLDNNTLALRTGMTCRVEIAIGGGVPRPVVPLEAILTEQSGNTKDKPASYVLAVVDGVVRKRVIELGMADDHNQEVLKGLMTGDIVASGPARVLRALQVGDRVEADRAVAKLGVHANTASRTQGDGL